MHIPRLFPVYLLWLSLLLNTNEIHGQDIQVANLKVEHLHQADLQVVNGYLAPGSDGSDIQRTGIANKQPVFGWELMGTVGATQSAYRILVSANTDSLKNGVGEVWDSGKVAANASINVRYGGPALSPNATYAWQVMAWNTEDAPSAWSPTATFRTADELVDYRTAYHPLQKTDEAPAKIRKAGEILHVDFAKASFGQLRLNLTSAVDGQRVTVRFGEAVNPDGSINRKPGGTIRYAEYPLALRRGTHTYMVQFKPDKRNTGSQAILMPDYIGEVLPFRYVELAGYERELKPSDITRSTVHYPFDDLAAHFESSDTVLNAVWELCKYSIKATSFAGIYVDGDRERIPYEADAYINQLSHYSVDKDFSMARRSHEYLMHRATWPTEWILQSVLMAYHDYLYTGDIRSAAAYYGDLKAKLLLPLREANGLVSTKTGKQTPALLRSVHFDGKELRDIVDWPHTGGFGMEGNGEVDGFVFTDYNAVVNAFHYKALRDMNQMALALGKETDALMFDEKARETYDAFQRLLWNKSTRAYQDGVDTDHSSLHTNMLAMAFGLVPDKRRTNVMSFIRSRGMACSVYGSQFLMDAVYDAGDAEYGLSLLTSQADRSWYNMIRAGSTITMEAWDNKFKPNQDWNHAWGAVPANAIPRKLMGITPLTPGWSTFQVRPQLGSLKHASIKAPTIRGTVTADCTQDEENFLMDLVVPGNTTAEVAIPLRSSSTAGQVMVNGKAVRVKPANGWIPLPQLGPGTHRISIAF